MEKDIYKGAIKDLLSKENITFFSDNLNGLSKKEFLIKHTEELFTKSFWDYKNITRGKNDDIDGDREDISYCVYWILWGDTLKKIEKDKPNYNYYDLKYEEDFSGDTICTFNTIFNSASIRWLENYSTESVKSSINEEVPKPFNLIHFSNNELKEINEFRRLYETLGNFYILPKKTIPTNTSINTYRSYYWRDYFDTFLNHLDKTLQTNYKENNQDDFSKLLNKNSFFFNEYKTLDSFLTLFHLEVFKDYKIEGEHIRFWDLLKEKNPLSPKVYKKQAMDYIRKTTPFINARAERLQEAFKEKLRKMDQSNFD